MNLAAVKSVGRCATQTHWTSVAGEIAAICGVSSVRTSVRQQPIFSICPHCPCIARQQALSSWLIATLVKQAITGAAAVSRRRMATMLAKRRTASSNYTSAFSETCHQLPADRHSWGKAMDRSVVFRQSLLNGLSIGWAPLTQSSTENYQQENHRRHTNHHNLSTFLRQKHIVSGARTRKNPAGKPKRMPEKPKINHSSPQITAKNRRLILSTAKWSIHRY